MGRPGRPKGKELSARERAARIANPTKTGEHAKGAAQWLRPCKRACCPPGVEFPCQARTVRIESGHGAPAYCLITIPQPHEIERITEAYRLAREGSSADLDAVNDQRLAQLTLLQIRETDLAMMEGAAIPIYAVNAHGEIELDADGQPQLVKMLSNPRVMAVVELAKVTGATATDQLLTPKSQEREPNLDDDAVLAEIREGNKLLADLQEKAGSQHKRGKRKGRKK